MKIIVNASELNNAIKGLSTIKIKDRDHDFYCVYIEHGSVYIRKIHNLVSIIKLDSVEIIESDNSEICIPSPTMLVVSKLDNADIVITNDKITSANKTIDFRTVENLTNKSYENLTSTDQEEVTEIITLTEQELVRMLDVSYAIAKDDTRPILTGVCLTKDESSALDGYRLSVRKTKSFELQGEYVLSPDLVSYLLKSVDKKSNSTVVISFTNKKIKVEFKNYCIIAYLMQEGEWIQYDSLIPKEFRTVISVDKKEANKTLAFLKDALKDSDNSHIVYFSITKDKVVWYVSTENNKVSVDLVNATTIFIEDTNEYKIAFNIKYVIDAFKNSDNHYNYMKLQFNAPVSPIVMSINNKDLELVLPVRLAR